MENMKIPDVRIYLFSHQYWICFLPTSEPEPPSPVSGEQMDLLSKSEKEDCKKTYVHMTDEKTNGDICKCP